MPAMAICSFGGFVLSAFAIVRHHQFALAERLCGAPDRLHPPGMSRPCRCVRRAAPATFTAVLHGLLQHCSNIYPLRKTLQLGAPSTQSDASKPGLSSAACV